MGFGSIRSKWPHFLPYADGNWAWVGWALAGLLWQPRHSKCVNRMNHPTVYLEGTVFFVNYISGKLGEEQILLKYRKRLMKNDYVQEAGIERYLRGWKTRL